MAFTKCIPYRPHDYMYDPIFTVSGPTDHYKAAMVAKMSAAKFQICPIFPNMFSDLSHRPRVQLIRRRTPAIQPYREKTSREQNKDPAQIHTVDVVGADRSKFFCHVINFPSKDALPYTGLPIFTIEKIVKHSNKKMQGNKRDVQVETRYRESSAQTIPWEPPYKIIGKGDPEILKLEFLKWGSGLPAGMHEILLIERARMKAAWEKVVKPDINDEGSVNKFRDYLEALERDEWIFREKEIQETQDLRLELLEKMLNEIHNKSNIRAQKKIDRIIVEKEAEKEEQLEKIRKKTARELRKLEAQKRGFEKKYRAVNIIDEHIDKKSEIYAPLMRHGEHPKRWNQIIDNKLKKYKAQFIGVQQFSTLPRWLDQATKIKKGYLMPKSTETKLCIKETRWTAPVLKELHEELKYLRKEANVEPCRLRTKLEEVQVESYTPEVEGIPQLDEDKYQAVILLQSIIRGRAIQMMIYEGRDRCKELIHELKHSVGLLKKEKEKRAKEKLKVRVQQREETIQLNMINRLQGTLGKLQGSVVGTLLDFLNKELRRLLEERKAHAMCLLNERERYIREAAEAGRRQKELRRRREHDEMFKQIVKITQESVDVYLQDIITEGMDFASKEEATEYVLKLAEKIEKETDEAYAEATEVTIDGQDEIIADLVHNFVLPDIQKKLIRKKICMQQKQNLKTVHESVYSKFEDLPKIIRSTTIAAEEDISIKLSDQHESQSNIASDYETELSQNQDPIELYLNRLVLEELEGHDACYDFNIHVQNNLVRNEELDTITEIDSESNISGI